MKKSLFTLLIIFPYACAFSEDNKFFYARTPVNLSEYKKVTQEELPVFTEENSTKLFFIQDKNQSLMPADKKNDNDRSAGISEVVQVYDFLNEKINTTIESFSEAKGYSPDYNGMLSDSINTMGSDIRSIQDVNEVQSSKIDKLGDVILSGELRMNAMDEKISPLAEDISLLKQDTDNIRIQSESVVKSMGMLNEDISAVQNENEEQNNKIRSLNHDNEYFSDNINLLMNNIIPINEEIYGLKFDSKEREKEINNLESAIELTDIVNFEQSDKIDQQEKVLSDLKAGSDKLITDLKDVRKKSNTTTNVANANRRDIDKHATKIDKNTLDILKNRQDLRSLENDLRETNERLDNGLAASAALNGLFQPYGVGKLNITAAMGGYQSTQAVAVGTGYRFNENIAVKTGVAYTGSNDVMYNMAFNLEW